MAFPAKRERSEGVTLFCQPGSLATSCSSSEHDSSRHVLNECYRVIIRWFRQPIEDDDPQLWVDQYDIVFYKPLKNNGTAPWA